MSNKPRSREKRVVDKKIKVVKNQTNKDSSLFSKLMSSIFGNRK